MNTQRIEVIPATWTDEHDVPFFRAVREIFPRQLLDAAAVLLASYDADVSDETNSGSWGNAPTRRRVLESVAADIGVVPAPQRHPHSVLDEGHVLAGQTDQPTMAREYRSIAKAT